MSSTPVWSRCRCIRGRGGQWLRWAGRRETTARPRKGRPRSEFLSPEERLEAFTGHKQVSGKRVSSDLFWGANAPDDARCETRSTRGNVRTHHPTRQEDLHQHRSNAESKSGARPR